uniref:NAD(P)-binding domain-containing protein n=1 Tax=Micromonospora acroterricola TaxID=2202421 RepID=UPI00191BEEFF
MTTTGIVGAGQVGSQIARAAVANGDTVVIANSRTPETLDSLIADLGPAARAAYAAEAAPPATSRSSPCPSRSSTTCRSRRWPARS